MEKLLLALMFGLISCVSSASQENEIYQYIEISSRSTIRIDAEKKQIIIDGHSVLAADDCAEKVGYKCIGGKGGSFVFPIGQLTEEATWDFKGQEFKVLRRASGHLLGRKYSGFLIQSHLGDDYYWYLISPIDGLLAFGALSNKKTETMRSTFILEGKCGFAAARGCF